MDDGLWEPYYSFPLTFLCPELLPGGGLQGLIFMIKYNESFLRPPIPRPIKGPVSKSNARNVKFVDDGIVGVSLDLRECFPL